MYGSGAVGVGELPAGGIRASQGTFSSFSHEKKQQFGFRPGLTQIGLYSHRRWLEAGNFGFRK